MSGAPEEFNDDIDDTINMELNIIDAASIIMPQGGMEVPTDLLQTITAGTLAAQEDAWDATPGLANFYAPDVTYEDN